MPKSALHFSAKLLFQFRVVVSRKNNSRRLCEERIVSFKAQSTEDAWNTANNFGRAGEHKYRNHAGNTVNFEFIGIIELLHLGVEMSGPQEVWYDLVERVKPSERKSTFIPRKRDLQAFADISLRRPAPRLRKSKK